MSRFIQCLAIVVLVAYSTSAAPGTDAFTKFVIFSSFYHISSTKNKLFSTRHCPSTCESVRNGGVVAAGVDPVSAKIASRYRYYGECMNDCMCSAYCVIFENLANWPMQSCAPTCRRARPYQNGNSFFELMEQSLDTM